ncbi:DUF2835 family protein [Aliikangiella sp. IMCC44653]
MQNQGVNEVRFRLNISAQEYLKYYRGQVHSVLVVSDDGKKVRFPANLLQPYVTKLGICGYFCLRYSNLGKVIELVKLT